MFHNLVEALSWVMILSGSFFTIVGALGIIRFPHFWARLHAGSVSDSAGVILLIVGMAIQSGLTLETVKLILVGVFLFITGPTTTHAVADTNLVIFLRYMAKLLHMTVKTEEKPQSPSRDHQQRANAI